jgi:hypothetical protein
MSSIRKLFRNEFIADNRRVTILVGLYLFAVHHLLCPLVAYYGLINETTKHGC